MIQSELKEIFAFLFGFFKLLKTSFSSSVAKWKVSDLTTAYKWTGHVEDLHKRVSTKAYRARFVEHARILSTF